MTRASSYPPTPMPTERIIELSEGHFALYRGTWMRAKGDLTDCIGVREGTQRELPRLPRRSFSELPQKAKVS